MDSEPEGTGGKYVNHFQIGHNAFEFIFKFGNVSHDSENVQLATKLITSPVSAKLLSAMLVDSIGEYEHRFGKIPSKTASEPEGE